MVRGWEPSVEEALGELVGPPAPPACALSYLDDFPELYRLAVPAAEAAQDILRICELDGAAAARRAALPRSRTTSRTGFGSRPIASPSIIPLSDAVPVFENFGFRVLEEHPTAARRRPARLHPRIRARGRAPARPRRCSTAPSWSSARSPRCSRAGPRMTRSTSCSSPPRSQPRDVVLFRAWFRYLRQAGLSYGLVTVVEALRRAPAVAHGLIALFDALHDPAVRRARARRPWQAREGDRRRPRQGRGDRRGSDPPAAPRSRRGDSAHQRLRARRAARRWPSSSTAPRCPDLPAAAAVARDLGLFARASRASICAAARSPAAACDGPTGATISAPRSSA